MSADAPWLDYATPKGGPAPSAAPAASDADAPWKAYASPQAAPQAAAPQVGTTEDVIKGAAGGLGRGTAGLLGLPSDLPEYGARGLDWATRKVGGALGLDIAPRENRTPTFGAENIQKGMESVTGKFYEPKTIPGQYASTIAEFAPGMLVPGGGGILPRVANTIIGGTTSETAGQVTKGTAAEPWARAIGGIVGGVGGAKAITPAAPASASHRAAVGVLDREGIPMSAGQRTGSRPIKWMESTAADMPFSSGRAQQMATQQDEALGGAVTRRLYDRDELRARGVPDDVNLPDPRVAAHGPESLSDEYGRLTQHGMASDPQMHNRIQRAQAEYERLVSPNQRTGTVGGYVDDIVDRFVAGGGRMAGDEYQSMRSQIGTSFRAPGVNPQEAHALREIRAALDANMRSGIPPRDAAAWALNDQRYANMKQTQPATTDGATTGRISPDRLAAAVRARRGAQYAAQRGGMDEVAQAAAKVLKPMQNSGTAARTQMQQLFNFPTLLASGTGGFLGSAIGPLGTAAGLAAPYAAGRAVLSRPVQRYLGNQALPQNMRDVVAQAMLQQAISQPSGLARNQAEQDEINDRHRRPRVHVVPDRPSR